MSQSTGCVYLIGAGCGQADLITLRGLELLRQCDAVVYDDLIADELLQAAPPQARRIYMGKRLGRHSAPQEEISQTLVELAKQGLRVARLKGGDPFVFGRGGEEALALQAAGIPFQVVPGISSSIAIPALAGIPVTHRGMSRGFHVVTAHTAQGGRDDFDRLANLEGTLVFLMGLSHLGEIAQGLISAGRSPETPAAVVSGGCAPHPATVRAPLGQLAAAAEQANVQPPAVIVVGETAALDLTFSSARPLEGVQVALVGTPILQQRLNDALSPLGARSFAALTSQLEELPCSFDLNTLCDGAPRWVVLTSQNGVDCFFHRLKEQNIDLRKLHACRFAAIGKATEASLASHGIHADLCPPVHTTQALAQALVDAVPQGEPVYLFRSALGSPELYRRLAEHTHAEDIPLYTLQAPELDCASLYSQIQQSDYLVFSSASGVDFFLKTFGSIPEGPVCVCIGPVTAQALAPHCSTPPLIAEDISASGIQQTILDHWSAHK